MGIQDWFRKRSLRSSEDASSDSDELGQSLRDAFGEAPSELEAYFERLRAEPIEGSYVNLVSESECIKATTQFREFHPLVITTEAFFLDEANTSNHHFYLPDLPLAGSILYLSHDGDTRIVFRNLQELLSAANRASKEALFLDDLHEDRIFLADDQDRLNETIERMYAEKDQQDNEAAILLFIESSDLSNVDFFKTLAADDNFYFGEAVAKSIAARPAVSFLPIAEACASHAHPQVSEPGQKAVRLCTG